MPGISEDEEELIRRVEEKLGGLVPGDRVKYTGDTVLKYKNKIGYILRRDGNFSMFVFVVFEPDGIECACYTGNLTRV